MAVAYDAVSSQQHTSAAANPDTWTHTPAGTPRGVIVAFSQANLTTSNVTGITYGGQALSLVGTVAIDTLGEPGMAETWFLGTGLPTGAQTISVAFSASPTEDYQFVAVTVTAAADTEILTTGKAEENQADPAIVLSYSGRTGLAVGALASGRGTVADITWGAGLTKITGFINGFGSTLHAAHQTTAGSSDFTFGCTVLSDDVAMAAAVMTEVQAAGNPYYYYAQQ